MADEQATSPETPDTSATAAATGEGGSALTAPSSTAQGTAPSAKGAASEGAPAWMAQLEGDLKSDKSLTRYKTISELGKAHRELEGKLAKSVVLPDDKATDEDRNAFYKRLGVPEKPSDYKLDKVELPKGYSYEAKSEEEFKNIAHKLHLTAEQAKEAHAWYVGAMVKALKDNLRAVRTSMEECQKTLRADFGDNFNAEMTHTQRAFDLFANGDDEIKQLFNKSGLGNHPKIVKAFNRLGKAMGEAPFTRGAETANKAAGGEFGRRTEEQLAAALYHGKGA